MQSSISSASNDVTLPPMAMAATPAPPIRPDTPRVVWSWAFYDWANSAFATLVVTFIYSTYFTQAMAPDELTGTTWWSRAVAVSGILTALLAPRDSVRLH